MKKKTRILVADDHELIRDGIRARLAARPEWEICGEAADGREAVRLTAKLRPDVVILDIGMSGMNGITATEAILRERRETQVLILTMQESEDLFHEALTAGARGYLLKSDAARLLVTAVDTLLSGQPYFTGAVSDLVISGFLDRDIAESLRRERGRLTLREREIVQLLAEGLTSKDAARRLGLSARTVEAHRANLMRKLRLHSVADLVRYAVRNKIVQP